MAHDVITGPFNSFLELSPILVAVTMAYFAQKAPLGAIVAMLAATLSAGFLSIMHATEDPYHQAIAAIQGLGCFISAGFIFWELTSRFMSKSSKGRINV